MRSTLVHSANQTTVHSPIICCIDLVEVLATLFAEVFDVVGIRFLCGEADTGAVLPGIANLALHEITGHFVSDLDPEDAFVVAVIFEAVLRVLIERWWSWVLVVATNATDGLIVLLDIVHGGDHVV